MVKIKLWEVVTMSPVTKAQLKATAKYVKSNYDELKIRVPKGNKETIQAHAESKNESLNSFVIRAIDETMERDKTEKNKVN
jgi:predicted HicB family RNase H-like nuclease